MNAHRRPSAIAAGLLALLLLEASLEAAALAQPAPAPAAATATAAPIQDDKDVEARRSEARSSFEKGLALFETKAWDAALAELVRSRRNVSAAGTLANVSTAGLVVGGLGVAAGAIILLSLRTGESAPRSRNVALRVGLGRFDFEGRF